MSAPASDTKGRACGGRKEQRQRWNLGKVGTAAPPRTSPLTESCHTEDCGMGAGLQQTGPQGWSMTLVSGSSEPPRWWCSTGCAGRGIALAELRRSPTAPAAPPRSGTGCLPGCGSRARTGELRDTGWVLTRQARSPRSAAAWWCGGACAHAGLAGQGDDTATR